MTLCSLCTSISAWYQRIEALKDVLEASDARCKYGHHASYDILVASAGSGCELCDLFVYDISLFPTREYRLRHSLVDWQLIRRDVGRYLKEYYGDTQLQLTCFNHNKQFSPYGIFYSLGETVVMGALSFGSTIPFVNLRRYPEARIAQSWKWLEKCEHEHPECISPDPSYVPSRLVDVGSYVGSQLKLIDTDEHRASLIDSRYIALSYCWGSSMPKTGVTATWNLRRHLEAIKLSDLPKTVQDAVSIAHDLKVRYLWIDALCIMQNDLDDWQHESGAMSKIYSNAYCTIAAAATDHCNGGIFIEQDERQLSAVKLSKFKLKASSIAHRDLRDSSPLCTRAWAFQERELSPRILWFTKQMLVFECREMWASEEEPGGSAHQFDSSGVQDRSLNVFRPRTPLTNKRFSLTYKQATNDLGDLYLTWRSMVEKYSARILTRKSDKLPALSGLAHEFSNVVQSEYAAGLWINDIRRSLLWRRRLQQKDHYDKISSSKGSRSHSWETAPTEDAVMPMLGRVVSTALSLLSLSSQEQEPEPSTTFVIKEPPASSYIAPSWSWASSTVPVDYRTALHSRHQDPAGASSLAATVLSVSTKPLGSDLFGEVTSGYLKLLGCVRSLRDWMAVPRDYFIEEMVRWDEGWDWSQTEGVLIVSILRDGEFEDVPGYHGLLIREVESRDGTSGVSSERNPLGAVYRRVGLVKSVHASWLGQVKMREVILV